MKKFFYRVTEKDNVFSVAEKFGLSVCALIKLNELYRDIEEGDILYIESGFSKSYKVRLTDTLRSVAEKFGKKESEILVENGVPYIFYGLTITV